ncbi:MAG TPA: LuxR C-terminal-related transcriptional regulator [Gaiellaceae bacterium]|nr:LuxR C-terminal-related transcriptional regulator [Gaiellaceae bacterium]
MSRWEGVSPELAALIEARCTPRQIEVLQLVARGWPIRKIARALDTDPKNVRDLMARARRRLKDAFDVDELA